MLGKKWVTNGETEIQLNEDDVCPEGFTPGRKIKGTKLGTYSKERRDNISKACIGRTPYNKGKKEEKKHVYYTDGRVSIRIPYNEEPPSGFVRGRLKRRMTDSERISFNRKICKTKEERYGDKYYNNQSKTIETTIERYGVSCQFLRDDVYPTSSSNSKPNINFLELLEKNNIHVDDREFVIHGELKRYDFRVGDCLIEINPSAWHNSTFCPLHSGEPTDKMYHFNKTMTATKNGFRCINVWDWDDVDKIISLLKNKKVIGARKCHVELVSVSDARAFINSVHLQGYVPSKIRLGLYYDDKLISIMTFGTPRYNKNYQYELLRYCSIYNVIGGANKLFSYFTTNYSPKSVVSYCDLSKFSGKMYHDLGFRLINTSIGKHWYNMKLKIHITDNLLRKNGFDRLLGNYFGTFGKGTSNKDLMLSHGFVEIYDAGQATYSWVAHTNINNDKIPIYSGIN